MGSVVGHAEEGEEPFLLMLRVLSLALQRQRLVEGVVPLSVLLLLRLDGRGCRGGASPRGGHGHSSRVERLSHSRLHQWNGARSVDAQWARPSKVLQKLQRRNGNRRLQIRKTRPNLPSCDASAPRPSRVDPSHPRTAPSRRHAQNRTHTLLTKEPTTTTRRRNPTGQHHSKSSRKKRRSQST